MSFSYSPKDNRVKTYTKQAGKTIALAMDLLDSSNQ